MRGLDPHYPHSFLKPYRESLLWNTFSHLLRIMENTDDIITIYVGDKVVKVAKGKTVVKPNNCPQYY